MIRVKRFFCLPKKRKHLLVRAFFVAAGVQLALRVVSLPRLQRFIAGRTPHASPAWTEQEICWAAAVAARYTPGAACLVEALTAHYLLSRSGYQSRLRIGVRPEGSGITAHAWVELESNGGALRAGRDLGVNYTVLPL